MKKLLLLLLFFIPFLLFGQGMNVMHTSHHPLVAAAAGGGFDPNNLEYRTYTFTVPSTASTVDWQIPSWNGVPKAAIFNIVGVSTENTNQNNQMIGYGFTDGTNQVAAAVFSLNGSPVEECYRTMTNTACIVDNDSLVLGLRATFNAWLTGGVRLNFTGDSLAVHDFIVTATFFSGSDLSAKVGSAQVGAHVTTVGFTSKLIFTGTAGGNNTTVSEIPHILGMGVCTNGVNGLTQAYVGQDTRDAFSNASHTNYLNTTASIGQTYQGAETWNSTISTIDASGWNFGGTNADDIHYLAMTFNEDVDMGWSSIPTTGNISITEPGFEPSIAGLITSNTEAINSIYTSHGHAGVSYFDGANEYSLGVTGQDLSADMVNISWHYNNALQVNDYTGTTQSDGDFGSFTASGFDITMNTNNPTAKYYIWWAIQTAQ